MGGFVRGWAGALPWFLGAVVCAGAAPAGRGSADEATIRVRLLERASPVVIGGGTAGEAGVRVSALAEGLAVDSEPVGASWRADGAGPLRVDGRAYRGAIEVLRTSEGLAVVNELPLERYLAGTLSREMYADWPREALRAQAVVARTYALYRRDRRGRATYDLDAGTSSQVYGGVAAETPAVWRAVGDTRGEVLVYRGEAIFAAYHSTSGGRTASSEEVWGQKLPYLRSVEVEGEEDSPDAYWRVRVSRTTLGRALDRLGLDVGSLRDVRVVERSESGRARWLRVEGSEGTARVEGRRLRSALGEGKVKSTKFEIRSVADGFLIVGSGRGHGVGMSQWGARALAQRGKGYRKILSTFYPGAKLVRERAR